MALHDHSHDNVTPLDWSVRALLTTTLSYYSTYKTHVGSRDIYFFNDEIAHYHDFIVEIIVNKDTARQQFVL